MTDKGVLECFNRGLGLKNRDIADQICEGGMLHQPYEVVAKLLDGMVETNKEAKKKQEWDALATQLNALSTRVTELEVQAMGKEKHSSLRECRHGKKYRGIQDDEALSLIQQKIEAHEKMLNEMKENIEMLNEASTSHSMTIQLQEAQITHLMTGHYPPFAEDSPNYTMGDSEDEE
uniref:Uncharacterized protein n=1 Tax=Solanum tuberosum TaxID=4113 RepID=M1E126_SOLTU